MDALLGTGGECRTEDLGSHVVAALRLVGSVHQHLGLDDWDQSLLLANRSVSG